MTPLIRIAGWTLVHFVWQGAVIALIAAAALRLLRSSSPQGRYVVGCIAMTAMLAAPIATASWLGAPTPPTPAIDLPAPSAPPALAVAAARPYPAPEAKAPTAFTPNHGVEMALPALVAIWLFGVACLLARMTGGWWRVTRLHRASLAMSPSRWQAAAERLSERLRLGPGRRVHLVDSTLVDTPVVIGWWRPVVLLPIGAVASLAPEQVEAILAHELAHIRRHDFVVNLLQTVAETLLFYHPAVWWVSARIRVEREHCCDDVAVEVCGDAVEYAAALAQLETSRAGSSAFALAAARGPLLERVRRLLGVTSSDHSRSWSSTVIAVVVISLLIAFVAVQHLPAATATTGVTPSSAHRSFGPADVNRLLGFDLFPGPPQLPPFDPRGARAWQVEIVHSAGRTTLVGFTGRGLIRYAYDLRESPIINVPTWIDTETFALSATIDGNATEENVRSALRTLFENRLGLEAHGDTREFPVYALVRTNNKEAPGLNLHQPADVCYDPIVHRADPGGRLLIRRGVRTCGIINGITGLIASRVTMAEFVDGIQREFGPMVGRTIVDRTGLSGTFDATLHLGFLPAAIVVSNHPGAGILLEPLGIHSIFTALPVQLGLRLDEATAPFKVLVIDRAERPR